MATGAPLAAGQWLCTSPGSCHHLLRDRAGDVQKAELTQGWVTGCGEQDRTVPLLEREVKDARGKKGGTQAGGVDSVETWSPNESGKSNLVSVAAEITTLSA